MPPLEPPSPRPTRPLRRLRPLLVLALWPLLASTTTATHGSIPAMAKVMNGKAGEVPEDSPFVQVREHEVLGYRVTEVVLGRTELDAELPLVVRFHGRGDRPHVPSGDHSGITPVRLMLPWAPDKLGDGFTWFPLSVTERKHPKVLGHYVRERTNEFAKVLATFMERRPTREAPSPNGPRPKALVAGFSQGGMMTFGLALRHPGLVEAAFPVAGWLPEFFVDEALQPKRTYPPIRAMHGREDPIVPAEPAMAIVRKLQDRGLDATIEVFPWDQHSMSEQMWRRHDAQMRVYLDPPPPPSPPPGLG